MSNPVFNLNSPLVDKLGKIIPPWNSFFQQFTQVAPVVVNVTVNPYKPNVKGNVILTGATTIALTRGTVTINLTGQTIIPVGIGDIVSWTGPAAVKFLGA